MITNMEIQVVQATFNDLNAIIPLFDQYRIFYGQESDPASARLFLWEKFEHRESVIFIAKQDITGQILGFTQLFPSFSSVSMRRIWILNDLYVRPDSRNRGIGRLLMDKATEFAKFTDSIRIELTTAFDNKSAQALYESLGYDKDETFFHYSLNL